MSGEYVFECAQKFEALFAQAGALLDAAAPDAPAVQALLPPMEQCLNAMELETSLLGGEAAAEHALHRSCRAHFNETRRRLAAAEEGRARRAPRPALDDVEALHAKYGATPLLPAPAGKPPGLLRRRLPLAALAALVSLGTLAVCLL